MHEPGETDAESAFDGLVTYEASANYRKLAAAQDAGALGVMMVTDVHNHPEPANFSAAAAGYWPETVRRGGRYTLQSRLDRIRIPAVRVSTTLAESLVEGSGRTLEELSAMAESPGGITPVSHPGVRAEIAADVRRETLAGPQRGRPDRRIGSRAQGRVGHHLRALRPRWRRGIGHLQWGGRRRLRHRGAARDRGSLHGSGPHGRGSPSVGVDRGVELRGEGPARRVGVRRKPAASSGPDRGGPEPWT